MYQFICASVFVVCNIAYIAFNPSPLSPLKWAMPEATLKTSAPKPQNASWDEILEGEYQKHFGQTAQCWALVGPNTAQLVQLDVGCTRWLMDNVNVTRLQQWCQLRSAVEEVSLTLKLANFDDEVMDEIQLQHLVPKIE